MKFYDSLFFSRLFNGKQSNSIPKTLFLFVPDDA